MIDAQKQNLHDGERIPTSPAKPAKIKVTLRKIRLNNSGYDRDGGYWGVGGPLYIAMCTYADGQEVTYYFRARDRVHAKLIVCTNWKNSGAGLIGATFYN